MACAYMVACRQTPIEGTGGLYWYGGVTGEMGSYPIPSSVDIRPNSLNEDSISGVTLGVTVTELKTQPPIPCGLQRSIR